MGYMSGDFGFALPDESRELTNKEYVDLVNRIRGNFLSYVSVLDSTLTEIISGFFLRDREDFALWAKTVFDEDRASFGMKIVWVSRILKNHPTYRERIPEDARKRIQQRLDEIRIIRNDFAHNFAKNKQVEPENIEQRVIKLYDFEEGRTIPRLFRMQEIMDIINDPWILERLDEIDLVTRDIRKM